MVQLLWKPSDRTTNEIVIRVAQNIHIRGICPEEMTHVCISICECLCIKMISHNSANDVKQPKCPPVNWQKMPSMFTTMKYVLFGHEEELSTWPVPQQDLTLKTFANLKRQSLKDNTLYDPSSLYQMFRTGSLEKSRIMVALELRGEKMK